MPYRIDLNAGGDAIGGLVDLGALDIECSAGGGTAALMPDSITPEQIASVLGTRDISVSPAAGRDDGSVWVLSPRPIRVGGLRIVPVHLDAEPGSLVLTDAPAFGTGLHPTTALCLEALDEAVRIAVPHAVLDVGTGSGVLALGALILGVPRALAIDVDEDAVRVAAENARINRLDGRLRLACGGPEAVTGAWPLVLANVLAAPLMEMSAVLVRRVGRQGRLVLSGIPSSVEMDVTRAYTHLGMRLADVKARAGWVALVLQASW